MRLYAIGDLHVGHKQNREALEELTPHPGDGLILCGDIGETMPHLTLVFETATACFDYVFWVPGNHELYTMPDSRQPQGEGKYQECLALARSFGILTPEDPYMRWEGEGGPCIIAPIFTLYDYSFRPAHVSREGALAWAEEENIMATDEALLHPDPYPSRDAWCDKLVSRTEERLQEAAANGIPLIIINHWPLREDLVFIPLIPRFSLWCGTKKTEDWHLRFKAKVVINGHLHVRRTDWIDGVRFEECSLGYPRQWVDAKASGLDINGLLREILPGPPAPLSGNAPTQWRRWG
ncbi:transposase [Lepidopterella palustris CBS 459.81]|uniref:Transposase n=1 Tax=Lepidopterella palustris CBS 459.81 TaxID=1314670 RepID=A0A8E2E9U3_9PEZI|nr:transposase [Lepidopterella palustris CBS 459.81]